MDPKEEYERFMRGIEYVRKLHAAQRRSQIAHEDAQDELRRMTSAFSQKDCNKMLAECLARKK